MMPLPITDSMRLRKKPLSAEDSLAGIDECSQIKAMIKTVAKGNLNIAFI